MSDERFIWDEDELELVAKGEDTRKRIRPHNLGEGEKTDDDS